MNNSIFLAFSTILTIFLILNYSCNSPEKLFGDSLLVLKDVNLIDGNGGPVLPNSVVVVEGHKTIRIGNVVDYIYPEVAIIIKFEGKKVLSILMSISCGPGNTGKSKYEIL